MVLVVVAVLLLLLLLLLLFLLAVNAFQHCFLCLQSLCFDFSFRRGGSFLLHFQCHLGEKKKWKLSNR